jgi:hypothetical protein
MKKVVDLNKLLDICNNFIQEQKIGCPEAIWDSDRVIENAYEFIEEICECVGYWEYPDDVKFGGDTGIDADFNKEV